MPFESLIDLLAIDPPPKAEQPVSMTIKLIRNINIKNEGLILSVHFFYSKNFFRSSKKIIKIYSYQLF